MTLPFGQWPLGLDNRASARRLNPAALSMARDVLVEDGGRVQSARHPELSLALAGLSSLWTDASGQGYALAGNDLLRLQRGSAVTLGTVGGSGAAGFAEFAGKTYVSRAGGALYRIEGDSLAPAAQHPPAFTVTVENTGGLTAGRYGLCLCALEGSEEQGCSALSTFDVPASGGLRVTVSGSGMARVFVTEAGGSTPLHAADVSAGAPYLVGAGKRGAAPHSRYLEPLPGGRFLGAHGGRLYSGSGRTLYYSAALRPHLADLREGFIRLPSPIALLAAVEDGLYVGDRTHTYFYGGTDPDQYRLQKLSAPPPPSGCFAVLDGALFGDLPAVPVAVWLSSGGFVIGLPSGQCLERQSDRIQTPPAHAGSLACVQRRLYALTH